MDRVAWWATVHGVTNSQTQLSDFTLGSSGFAVLSSLYLGFPRDSVGEESACNTGDPSLVPGSRRSPGEENSNPLQFACLGNLMDRRVCWATVHEVIRVGHDLVTKIRNHPYAYNLFLCP